MSEPIRLHAVTGSSDLAAAITVEDAALRVAVRVAECEAALDNALIKACSLMAEIPLVRMEANLAAEHGQDAIEELVSTLGGIATARRHAVSSHGKLDETRAKLGVTEVAVGDKWKLVPAFAELRAMARSRRAAAA